MLSTEEAASPAGPWTAGFGRSRLRTVRMTESTASAKKRMPATTPNDCVPGAASARSATRPIPALTQTAGHSTPSICANIQPATASPGPRKNTEMMYSASPPLHLGTGP